MNAIKWIPGNDGTNFNNVINRFFDDSFFSSNGVDHDISLRSWNPKVDIYEKDDKFVINAELPGMNKKDIEIDLKDRVLTIKGERSHENEIKEDDYYHNERSYGKFQRAFTLPANLDPEKIKADFKDGILKIEIQKPEDEKPRQITIH